MNNYERIKNMTIEEMADFLGVWNDRTCVNCERCHMASHCAFPEEPCCEIALRWLKSEVAE